MKHDLSGITLSPKLFDHICKQVYSIAGISLRQGKETLVQGRLLKRLAALDLASFENYIEFVEQDRSGRELSAMIDVLTTNKTSFFRESQHFEFLVKRVLPEVAQRDRTLRIWSAACSSGEEPYTVALSLLENLPDIARWDIRILATDISDSMLVRARSGLYEKHAVTDVPPALVQKYFSFKDNSYQLREQVRSLVSFAKLNLMNDWPMRGPFDVIFCRNAMIYFDKSTQQQLVNRFWDLLKRDGHLFIGHSESLTGSAHQYRYIRPAVYAK